MASCRRGAVTREGQTNSVEVINRDSWQIKVKKRESHTGREANTSNTNELYQFSYLKRLKYKRSNEKGLMNQRGIDMLVGEGLVSGHMGAARREVPVGSHVLLSL